MSVADKDGYSVREILEGKLERALKSGRDRSKEIAVLEADLFGAPLPRAIAYLWVAYNRIRRRKGGSGFGVSLIEWPDIEAFQRNSRINLAPWEVEIIEELDDLYVGEMNRAARDKQNSEKR